MNIHITNLHNMGGTATLAQEGVVQIAKNLGFKEMPLGRRLFHEDYWKMISRHLDGTIASLYFGDVVIFQYPSWNGPDYDKVFVDKIKMYSSTRLIIFVHDFQKLMFNSEPHILETEVKIFNKADVLILPSEKMYQYLVENGLKKNIPVYYQKIWEVPGFPQFTDHSNRKRMYFTGNYDRFPFLKDYHGKTVIEQFDRHKPGRENDASFCARGFLKPIELMNQLSKGGFGLVWCDKEYFDRYYCLNQPHKLGFNLCAGIPVITRQGGVHDEFIRDNRLGYVVDSLEQADELVQNTSDDLYAEMVHNIKKYQTIMLQGLYTKKLLTDAVICAMEI